MKCVGKTLAAVALFGLLSGCGVSQAAVTEASPPPTAGTPEATAQTPAAPSPIQPVAPADENELKAALKLAMEAFQPELLIHISACDLGSDPALAVQNLYYALAAETPELKYTYDIAPVYDAAGQTIHIAFSYMPYKVGTQMQDDTLWRIDSIQDLIAAAEGGIGQEAIGIYIQNPDLDVDTMSLALGQVGGGWILCSLNCDATQVLFRPVDGRTMEDCLRYIAQTNALADALIAELCTANMTQAEQLMALYTHLAEQVRYDQRYYADLTNMPYESTTAYGALHDGVAICGGYAQALQLLSQKIGLDCYTVSGKAGGENHMWNIIRLDGQWRYYDATYDRGRAQFGFQWYGVAQDALTETRSWNQAFGTALMADLDEWGLL